MVLSQFNMVTRGESYLPDYGHKRKLFARLWSHGPQEKVICPTMVPTESYLPDYGHKRKLFSRLWSQQKVICPTMVTTESYLPDYGHNRKLLARLWSQQKVICPTMVTTESYLPDYGHNRHQAATHWEWIGIIKYFVRILWTAMLLSILSSLEWCQLTHSLVRVYGYLCLFTAIHWPNWFKRDTCVETNGRLWPISVLWKQFSIKTHLKRAYDKDFPSIFGSVFVNLGFIFRFLSFRFLARNHIALCKY